MLIEKGWTPTKKVALKVPGWHHSSATIFRLVRQYMGLITSQPEFFESGQFYERFGPQADTLIYYSRLECRTSFYQL